MEKTGVIYLHKNKINGKCYIGSTLQAPNRRWRKNDQTYNSYKNCTVFYRALNKYGWGSFETIILEDNVLESKISEKEEHFINKYNSIAPNGYNSVKITNSRVEFTEDIKNKISKSRKKYYKNLKGPIVPHNKKEHVILDGIKQKECSKCNTLKPLSSFGKYKSTWDGLNRYCKKCHKLNSKEYRKKKPRKTLSEAELKESYKNRKTVSRPFLGINENGDKLYFKSGMDASRNGYDKTGIRRSILKGRKYKGYTWHYADEYITKIFARKCVIKRVDLKDEQDFLTKHHEQGYCASSVCYGLYYNLELVQIMSFSKPRFNKKYEWEVIRLCSKTNTIVVGGASKLLSSFIKNYNPSNIMTYADKNYSKAGKVYEKIGFKYVKDTINGYFYEKDGIKLSRFQCQKHKLHKVLKESFNPEWSETKNMKNAGYQKIYDLGNKLYELILK